jgi:multidrug transporter EmrE-like cation transporter
VNLNAVLPLTSSVLSFVLFLLLADQWRERRRPYQLVWAIGMLWYGLSAGTEFLGGAFGWSEPLYRTWYLIGAIWVAGWLGLGTVILLARTRFGLALVPVFLLLALISLGGAKTYPDTGIASPVYAGIALALAILVGWLAFRRDPRWAAVVAAWVVGGSVLSAILMATVTLPAPGWVVDPLTHIPTGALFPGYLRLLTPLFNVVGAFALTFGALFSAYVFMPKRRVVRYDLAHGSLAARVANLLVAVVAFPVNLVASLPGAIVALIRGRLNSRVPATILIAIGALVPAITSGLNRFGSTGGFFVGELLGVVFLLAGFLVSVEVVREIRVPFTGLVLRSRRADATVDM